MTEAAAAVIGNGGLVAFPTETVYGLGANALDARAVARIFEAKARPRFDPLIIHVDRIDALDGLVESIPPAARSLAERFWPGPLTLVLAKTSRVPDIVTAGLPTVAVRIPRHDLALELLRAAGPIAAPSANRFGCLSPTTAQDVVDQLGTAVDLVLDGGPCEVGVESTIISFAGAAPVLLRPGGTPVEEIEPITGKLVVPGEEEMTSASPGRQKKHYAPKTRIVFQPEQPVGRCGLLCLRRPADTEAYHTVEELSPRGDLNEAATNLFAALRRLDQAELDLVVAEPVPETGLGRAIMDRLRRAAS